MPRSKKSATGKQHVVPGIKQAREISSDACKLFLIELVVKFYEKETNVSLDSKYLRYQEECLSIFQHDMTQKVLDALNVLEWTNEMEKKGFNKVLENKVHDALWNAKVVLQKYGKQQRPDDERY